MLDSISSSNNIAIDANGLNDLRRAAKDNSPEAIKATAQQFEAMFMNMMLKSMRDATPQDGPMDSEQTRTFTGMLDQQLSQNLSKKGLGLADVLTRQLSKTANTSTDTAAPAVSKNEQLAKYQTIAAMGTNPASVTSGNLQGANPVQKAFRQNMAAAAQEASILSGIPASYLIGQAGLESGWGKHEIRGADGSTSFNLFGIKAGGDWKGKTVSAVTTEYINGEKQQRIEKFRAYDSYADSFKDFTKLIRNNSRYDSVVGNGQSVADYAQAIQKSGYATDPQYANKLSHSIQLALAN